jgi:putative ABC transport system permease protein
MNSVSDRLPSALRLPLALRFPLALRLALRELRGGARGFYVFVICIALGVGAIASVGGLTEAFQDSLRREGRNLLGGDAEANLVHRRIALAELEYLASFGKVSEVASLRAMARKQDGSAQALIDVKAVDDAYPLYDAITFKDEVGVVHRSANAISQPAEIAVAPSLLDQLDLKIGDKLKIGAADFTIAATIVREPDNISGGMGLGVRAMISLKSLAATGLDAPGSLIVWRYRVKASQNGAATQNGASTQDSAWARAADPAADIKRGLKERFPEGGFTVRGHTEPAPGLTRSIGHMGGFLTLAGLTALLVGGVGAANAVAAFIENKRKTIAAYKALGASGSLIVSVFLLQTLFLAGVGVLAGVAIGVVVPKLTGEAYGDLLPFHFTVGVYPAQLALAGLDGFLVSLAFILWPLGRAQQIRAGELLREGLADGRAAPPWRFMAGSAASLTGLVASAVLLSQDRQIALVTCAVVGGVFALFWGVGRLLKWAARTIPRPSRPELALALCAIGEPGGSAAMLTVSLGAGLTMLTTVALVDASLSQELELELPKHAPSHFFIGVPKGEYERFAQIVTAAAPKARLEKAPELRGRFVALAGKPVETIKPPKDIEWALNGDRGLTFSDAAPEGSRLTAGNWWPKGYQGPPLVSFDSRVGKALKLNLGDEIIVNILGRNITAAIANFRTVKWESLGINFVMTFSPNTLEAAPYNYLATLNWPRPANGSVFGGEADEKAEGEVARAVGQEFPSVTIIRVRDALETVHGILVKIMSAIRAAGMLTLVMGGFVMAGALAAASRRRIYQAVILKIVGAPPRRILMAHLIEHLTLALATAAAATVLGSLAAYAIVAGTMEAHFNLSPGAILQATALGSIFALTVSAYDSYKALKAKAAPYLRAES